MRTLAYFCVLTCVSFVGGCTNDGIDLSGTDAAKNNTPDSTVNNMTDSTVNNPDTRVGEPDSDVGEPDASVPDASVPDAKVPDAKVPDAEVPAPTFTQVQSLLMNNCGGCHTTNESGGLKLTDKNTAYNELVGVTQEASTAGGCGTVRVVADDAANSVLIQRLKGTCSNRMPKSGPPFLSDEQIQMVEDWINDGAQNN